jgi:hypothetical protein
MDMELELRDLLTQMSIHHIAEVQVYPFTTENISGYLPYFDLKDRSLLTVGSSGDQVISAIMQGCKDVTLYDICGISRFYYYLKVAGIISLTQQEFMNFFRYENYNRWKKNENVFNRESYLKLNENLRLLDYESYLFFDELFTTFSGLDIRELLFIHDEDTDERIIRGNRYLQSPELYAKAGELLKKVRPKFVKGDIFKLDDKQKYDNIWLSNIATWLAEQERAELLINTAYRCLNKNGQLLASYLYAVNEEYRDDYAPIYNIEKVFETFKQYGIKLEKFEGINSDLNMNWRKTDGVLLIKKR